MFSSGEHPTLYTHVHVHRQQVCRDECGPCTSINITQMKHVITFDFIRFKNLFNLTSLQNA